jgi:hypothetical protein
VNIDAKLISKIMANQTQKPMKKIVYHDQVKINPGMLGWFNIHKSSNIRSKLIEAKTKTT